MELFPDRYMEEYRECVRLRGIQLAIAEGYSRQMMRCPIHLSVGQEYWLPLFKKHFRHGDRCFASHRSHSMYLALSNKISEMIAELHGSTDKGALKGRGGSMHLKDLDSGLELSNPIVGSAIALSLGSALSAAKKGGDILTVTYFGDGACEEGILHESLNLASVLKLPILFLCENNGYSCNTTIRKRQSSADMSRFAKAHNIKTYSISKGASYDVIDETLERAMTGSREKPIFLEINSYRLYEHCGHRLDMDAGDRDSKEYELHEKSDPINSMLIKYPELGEFLENEKAHVMSLINKMSADNEEYLGL